MLIMVMMKHADTFYAVHSCCYRLLLLLFHISCFCFILSTATTSSGAKEKYGKRPTFVNPRVSRVDDKDSSADDGGGGGQVGWESTSFIPLGLPHHHRRPRKQHQRAQLGIGLVNDASILDLSQNNQEELARMTRQAQNSPTTDGRSSARVTDRFGDVTLDPTDIPEEAPKRVVACPDPMLQWRERLAEQKWIILWGLGGDSSVIGRGEKVAWKGSPECDLSQIRPTKDSFCEQGALPAFIRVPQAMIMGIPTIVTTVEVVTCAGLCRNNTEPNSGAERLCQGFNFQDSGTPTCEFFDVQAQLGPLNRNVGVRSFYYDKICLRGIEACYQRPYAFEAVPDAQLQGNVLKSVVVPDESSCLSACISEESFTCQSVNYVRAGRVCEMSQFNRRSKVRDFATNVQGVDYYENNCLTKNNRCQNGEMYFVKTFNNEIRGFDVSEGSESLNSCLNKCLDSDYILCRSAEYNRNSAECLVSDEDSFSMPGMVSTAEAVGIDLYEPVCLPGASEASIQCKRPYLFEKVLNTALNVPEHFRVLNGMTPEDCMMTCSRDSRCKSLNYNRDSQTCMLSEYDRRNSTASLGRAFRVDYYENNCQKANTIQGCFFTLEGVGRKLRPEFRNREIEAVSSVDCKMSCIRLGDVCKSVSFNEKDRTCYHSQLDTNSAPFELLAQIDLDFDTYIKGECVFEEQGNTSVKADADGIALTNTNKIFTRIPAAKPSTTAITKTGTNRNVAEVQPSSTNDIAHFAVRLPRSITKTQKASAKNNKINPTPAELMKIQKIRDAGLFFGPFRDDPVRGRPSGSDGSFRPSECGQLQLRARHRRLRPFYSNNHIETSSLEDCRLICVTMSAYECRSISYSTSKLICSLSELEPGPTPLTTLTQFDDAFMYYTKQECPDRLVSIDNQTKELSKLLYAARSQSAERTDTNAISANGIPSTLSTQSAPSSFVKQNGDQQDRSGNDSRQSVSLLPTPQYLTSNLASAVYKIVTPINTIRTTPTTVVFRIPTISPIKTFPALDHRDLLTSTTAAAVTSQRVPTLKTISTPPPETFLYKTRRLLTTRRAVRRKEQGQRQRSRTTKPRNRRKLRGQPTGMMGTKKRPRGRNKKVPNSADRKLGKSKPADIQPTTLHPIKRPEPRFRTPQKNETSYPPRRRDRVKPPSERVAQTKSRADKKRRTKNVRRRKIGAKKSSKKKSSTPGKKQIGSTRPPFLYLPPKYLTGNETGGPVARIPPLTATPPLPTTTYLPRHIRERIQRGRRERLRKERLKKAEKNRKKAKFYKTPKRTSNRSKAAARRQPLKARVKHRQIFSSTNRPTTIAPNVPLDDLNTVPTDLPSFKSRKRIDNEKNQNTVPRHLLVVQRAPPQIQPPLYYPPNINNNYTLPPSVIAPPKSGVSNPKQRDPLPTANALLGGKSQQRILEGPTASAFTGAALQNIPATAFGTEQNTPRVNPGDRSGLQPQRNDRRGLALAPSNVELSAICSNDGVNVSVITTGAYTGAIYAAERFSFCRNLVTGQSSFWLFLPRPEINSACNTIMVNDVLSGVIVISNDNVTPYDVTTKDDLFYQVSCDFAGNAGEGGKVIVTGGLVVGGPTPRVVAGAGLPSTFDATLRILRNGIPVQNVLIGEQLSLNIESSIDPARMMLINCNVSRIGGSGPLPEPLQIVDNGCPVVSQVVGAIERGPNGLFSSLTAFRIDGSAEIQIVCMVMFCPQQCQPVICPRSDGSTVSSFGRRKREIDLTLSDASDTNVLESVNGRLKVYVEGEDGAPSFDEITGDGREGSCVAESTFVAVTAVLGLLVALLMSCLACMLCRRSWMVTLQHKILTEQFGRSVMTNSEGGLSDRSSETSTQVIKSIHPHRPPLLTNPI